MEDASELGNYLPQKDFENCSNFDLTSIADRPEIGSICELHKALKTEYGQNQE
jgi:hypothetical protein